MHFGTLLQKSRISESERPYKPHVDLMSENNPAFARPALGSGTKCRVMNHRRETDGFGRSSATGVHTLLCGEK